jgi:serine phosphatase RsbU (regulator of sigma subunit)
MANTATILVVDDDHAVRDSILAFLNDAGYTTFSAENGAVAIELVDKVSPDVVVCDLNMPMKNGLDVLRHMKIAAIQAPVIIMSGIGGMTDVIDALRLGASDYFRKPIGDLAVLEHAIKRCIQQNLLIKENIRYREELERANRDLQANLKILEQDQQAGRQLQLRLLPESPLDINGYRFEHRLWPSLYLSGDFVDYLAVGEDKITFFMADVSGHGASSAFVTALLKNFTAHRRSEYMRKGRESIVSPIDFLTKANEMLISADVQKHMTMCFCVIDVATNTLSYSVAGHLPLPILVANGEPRYLDGQGMPVGLFDNAEFNVQTVSLPDKFSLYLFSDGILEILPPKDLADKESLLLGSLADANGEVDDVCRRLFISSKDLPDDIAVLTISKG